MSTMDDYIETYPSQYDPDIQEKTSVKQEFIEVNGKPTEKTPKRGEKYRHQEFFLRYMRQYDRLFKFDNTGTGKCLDPYTEILMFDGRTKFCKDVIEGDLLMGPDSDFREVIGTTKGEATMYKIVPAVGKSFRCNGPHILTLKGINPHVVEYKQNYKHKNVVTSKRGRKETKIFKDVEGAAEYLKTCEEDVFDISVDDYMKLDEQTKKNCHIFHQGVEFDEKDVPMNPYTYGKVFGRYLIESPEMFENYLSSLGNETITALFKDLISQGEKRLPEEYKYNLFSVRYAFLGGIFASSFRYDVESGYMTLRNSSESLIDDITYIFLSVGLMAVKSFSFDDSSTIYNTQVFIENLLRVGNSQTGIFNYNPLTFRDTCFNFDIIDEGKGDYAGFQVTGDGRFLLGDFTVTHNSCTMIGLSEYYQENPGKYKHAYVLEKGASTMQDFRHQLVCKCTVDKYETETIKRSTNSQSRATNITNEIKRWYTITTYTKFATPAKTMSDEAIREKYSNCLIFIDEAHGLRNVKKGGINSPTRKPRKTSKSKSPKSETSEGKLSFDEVYNIIFRIVHTAENIKVVVATATVNINDVGDFVPITNLLLPLDRQLPYHSESGKMKRFRSIDMTLKDSSNEIRYDYRFITASQMEPFVRGVFSFARSLDTGVDIDNKGVEMDEPIDIPYVNVNDDIDNGRDVEELLVNVDGKFKYAPSTLTVGNVPTKRFKAKTIVYPLRMSKFQSKIFRESIIENAGSGIASTGIASKQHASEFVFPRGEYGGNLSVYLSQEKRVANEGNLIYGLSRYVVGGKNGEYTANEELKELLRDPKQLWKHSCKFYEILRIEKSNPDSNSFIFTDSVTGAGSILYGLMFDEWGYSKYKEDESAFEPDYKIVKGVKVLNKESRKIRIEKKLRYCVLSSSSSEGRISSMMELFNSDENAHGEYISIMIGTLVARDGINLYNTKRGYLSRAGWHPSGDLQALARFIRAVSHEALLKEMRIKYKKEGRKDEPRITVEVYRMCSYTYDGVTDEDDDVFNKGAAKIISDFSRKGVDVVFEEEERKIQPRRTIKPSPRTSVRPSPRTSVRPSPRTSVKPSPRSTVKPSPRSTVKPSPRTSVRPSPRTSVRSSPRTSVRPSPRTVRPSPRTSVRPSPRTSVKPSPRLVKPSPRPVKPSPRSTVKPSLTSSKRIIEETESEGETESESGETESESGETESEDDDEVKEEIEEEKEFKKRIVDITKFKKNPADVVKTGRIIDSQFRDRMADLIPRFVGTFLCKTDQIISTDLNLYRKGEIKDIYNKRMERIFKTLAVDGINNVERNVRKDDVDYSINADYSLAKYDFWGKWPQNNKNLPVDYSTYDIFYYKKDIVKISKEITDYLLIHGSITIENAIKLWTNNGVYREKFLWVSLDILFYEKKPVTNRLGFTVYINTDGKNIFLQNEFPFTELVKPVDLTFYSDKVVGVETNKIPSVLDEISSPYQNEIIEKIMDVDIDSEDSELILNEYISKLTISFKTNLFEKSLLVHLNETQGTVINDEGKEEDSPVRKYINDNPEKTADLPTNIDVVNYIVNKYSAQMYLDVYEPLKDINEVARISAKEGMRKGAKKSPSRIVFSKPTETDKAHKDGTPYKVNEEIDPDDVIEIQRVYLNTIHSTNESLSSYNKVSKYENVDFLVRIFKPSENFGWRFLSSFEKEVYTNLIKTKMSERKTILEENDIYGTLFSDGFRIVDRRNASRRGFRCDQALKPVILDVLRHFNLMTPSVADIQIPENYTEEDLRKFLISKNFNIPDYETSNRQKYTMEDLKLIYKWRKSGARKSKLCDTLQSYLKSEGLLDEIHK
jgi:hypothetical protein